MSSQRYCSYNTARGNSSFWSVSFNITNRGASAYAPVEIAVNGTRVVEDHYLYVASGATTEVHDLIITDSAIPVDATCRQYNVTVGINGYVFF